MSFWKLFGGNETATRADHGQEQPTAVDYVEWLLVYMSRSARFQIVLDTSGALPGVGQAALSDPPPCQPPAESVLNRLKILAGINPVKHREAVRGEIKREKPTHTEIFAVEFHDKERGSRCNIQLSIKPKRN